MISGGSAAKLLYRIHVGLTRTYVTPPACRRSRPSGNRAKYRILELSELRAGRFVRHAFDLQRGRRLVVTSANHQSDGWIAAEIPGFARGRQRVEDDVERVGHDDSHDGGLRSAGGRHRRLHRVPASTASSEAARRASSTN